MIYNSYSHLNAVFAIAKIIKNLDNDAVFISSKYNKNHIENQGFTFKNLLSLPFAMSFEADLTQHEQKSSAYLDNLINRLSFRIYQDRKKKLEALIEEIKPNVIFLDSFLSTDFIILYPLLKAKGIKLVFLQTMLSTLYSQYSPPLNTSLTPENQKLVKKAWSSLLRHRKKLLFKDKIRYLGKDDLSMVKQKFKENKIPEKYKIITKTSFRISFADIPEWILAPAELEFFPEGKATWQTYIGSMIDLNRKEVGDEKFTVIEKQISALQLEEKKIIYCSFGTLYDSQEQEVMMFMENLLHIAKEKINFQFVIVLKENLQAKLDKTPNNIHLFSQIPQLYILSKTDLFITHGGLNSVKEALHFIVPMLIYPLNWNYDQLGNAARIFYHRLGLRGEISQDSPKEIAEKIQELLTNPIYKQNLQAFKEKTETKYTEERVLTLFEELMREPAWV
ncbi:glycosyltransferase [Thermoflexibacter ruber]|uniref:UDP:flavonoid glycosyltransferase YjiC, YdhE family n=1 Tax=Thermoflexibacter ruber TaxID=1003 RepID=A0A1I2FUU0_9BACT|nr:glycosyltransferase [Thermoflexibacter ruber]SFF09105.1 UDP:flavonoid glycosyltransferase YjiC, YdhE family [Thermoflexibacter ruber]